MYLGRDCVLSASTYGACPLAALLYASASHARSCASTRAQTHVRTQSARASDRTPIDQLRTFAPQLWRKVRISATILRIALARAHGGGSHHSHRECIRSLAAPRISHCTQCATLVAQRCAAVLRILHSARERSRGGGGEGRGGTRTLATLCRSPFPPLPSPLHTYTNTNTDCLRSLRIFPCPLPSRPLHR